MGIQRAIREGIGGFREGAEGIRRVRGESETRIRDGGGGDE